MSSTFRVLAASHFTRLFGKLEKTHPDLPSVYGKALFILASDPYNRTRTHPIKKLVNVPEGEGQYRLRLARWRFRYDIEDHDVILKFCGLRREETYR